MTEHLGNRDDNKGNNAAVIEVKNGTEIDLIRPVLSKEPVCFALQKT